MIDPHKKKFSLSIKKAIGTLQKVSKMIEEDRYCIDIAQQVNAVIGLLKQGNNTILESHLQSCAGKKLNSKDEKEKAAFVQELVRIFTVSNRK